MGPAARAAAGTTAGAKGYERLGPIGFGLGFGLLYLSRANAGPLSPEALAHE